MKNRKQAKKILGKYKNNLEVTSPEFDCGSEQCLECVICKYLEILEYAQSVAPAGSRIERDLFIEQYLKLVYNI